VACCWLFCFEPLTTLVDSFSRAIVSNAFENLILFKLSNRASDQHEFKSAGWRATSRNVRQCAKLFCFQPVTTVQSVHMSLSRKRAVLRGMTCPFAFVTTVCHGWHGVYNDS
jgi:hypothetical protein